MKKKKELNESLAFLHTYIHTHTQHTLTLILRIRFVLFVWQFLLLARTAFECVFEIFGISVSNWHIKQWGYLMWKLNKNDPMLNAQTRSTTKANITLQFQTKENSFDSYRIHSGLNNFLSQYFYAFILLFFFVCASKITLSNKAFL